MILKMAACPGKWADQDFRFFSVELETIQGVQVDARILSDLQAMIEAAEAKGLTLTLSSGYRSKERQAMLFENAAQENRSLGMNPVMAEEVAEQSVARAGHSEHETGLAIDLNGVLETFADTEATDGCSAMRMNTVLCCDTRRERRNHRHPL